MAGIEDTLGINRRGRSSSSGAATSAAATATSTSSRVSPSNRDGAERFRRRRSRTYGFTEYRVSATYRERYAFRSNTDLLFGVTSEQAVRPTFSYLRRVAERPICCTRCRRAYGLWPLRARVHAAVRPDAERIEQSFADRPVLPAIAILDFLERRPLESPRTIRSRRPGIPARRDRRHGVERDRVAGRIRQGRSAGLVLPSASTDAGAAVVLATRASSAARAASSGHGRASTRTARK